VSQEPKCTYGISVEQIDSRHDWLCWSYDLIGARVEAAFKVVYPTARSGDAALSGWLLDDCGCVINPTFSMHTAVAETIHHLAVDMTHVKLWIHLHS
jgi:hypothetical protein